MSKLLKDLFCDDTGKPSLTDVLVGFSFLLFALATVYLLFGGHTWPHYEALALYTVGSGGVKAIKYTASALAWAKAGKVERHENQ